MTKPRDPRMYLRDIVESCDLIVSYIGSQSIEDFRNNTEAQDAAIRRFEIIGEAVKCLPASLRKEHAHIPWRDIAGFRDVLIHDYPEIIIDDVFFTTKDHLPSLREQVQKILDDLPTTD